MLAASSHAISEQSHILARLLLLHRFSMIIDSSSFDWLGIHLKYREDDAQASTSHLDCHCGHRYPRDARQCNGEYWGFCSYVALATGSLGALCTHFPVPYRGLPLARAAESCFRTIGSRRTRKPPDHAGPSPEHVD